MVLSIVVCLLARHGLADALTPVLQNRRERPPLIRAIEHRDSKQVLQLLAAGHDVNEKDSWDRSALYWAVLMREDLLVAELCKRDALVNTITAEGYAPLHMATTSLQLVKILLAHGADPDVRDRQGRTPLLFSLVVAHAGPNDEQVEEFVAALRKAGADIDAKDKSGMSGLRYAAMTHERVAVDALLRNGADANQVGGDGETPLMLSLWKPVSSSRELEELRYYGIIEALCAHGANPLAKDRTGKTVIQICEKRGTPRAKQILVDSLLQRMSVWR